MPSGITHVMLVTYYKTNKTSSKDLDALLCANIPYLQMGAVGPDLPYASRMENIFDGDSELADLFHYKETNKIPQIAFKRIKECMPQMSQDKGDALFSFFAGYMSHVVADGIIHPFVRDKVGEYKENAKAHRCLEMALDVLVMNQLTKMSGKSLELNYTNFSQLFEEFKDAEHAKEVCQFFSERIRDVYGITEPSEGILNWTSGIANLFSLAIGHFPDFMRKIPATTGFFFKNHDDLVERANEYLVLDKPKEWEKNFLNKESIHFFEECIPQFQRQIPILLNKAYTYVYQDGEPLSEMDFPKIDLDTGLLLKKDSNTTPFYWRS